MRGRRLGWAVIAAAGLALELAALRDQAKRECARAEAYTLTATTAWLFNTGTPEGQAVFRFTWDRFSRWLVPHICAEGGR